jgi:hypothetical protein
VEFRGDVGTRKETTELAIVRLIKPSRRLVVVQMQGDVSLQEFIDYGKRLHADASFHPDFDVFVHIPETANPLFTQKNFDELISLKVVNRTSKRAYVVSKDFHFGFLRMYEGHRKREDENNFWVFRDVRKALEWLNTGRRGDDILILEDLRLPEPQ